MNAKLLKKYAELIVETGVNLKKGEELFISAETDNAPFAREIALAGYKKGAVRVTVQWSDRYTDRLRFTHESKSSLTDIPAWQIARSDYIADRKCCYVCVLSEDPDLMECADSSLISAVSAKKHELFAKFYDASMSNSIKWTIAATPTPAWAKKVFPELSPSEAVKALWEKIAFSVRLDSADPVGEWKAHCARLAHICSELNSLGAEALEFRSGAGTDLVVGLPENYVFQGGSELSRDGVPFAANMPTEEVFSAPSKYTANGRVVSSMPLVYNGKIVRDFGFTVKNGKIIDCFAQKGLDVLTEILNTDEGSRYLGEVALVPFDNPVNNLNTVFYNTLFDENARCHFAIGRAYPSCVKGGETLTKAELEAAGLNYSAVHVDFMTGTDDLAVTALKNGKRIPVMADGNFVL